MVDIREGEETTMNMTPMIDIVFQLIIFFLITLKFKTMDERIDASMPKDRGPFSSPITPMDTPKVKLKVFRKNKGDEVNAYTLVKIDSSHSVRLPSGSWQGTAEDNRSRLAAYDKAIAKIRQVLVTKRDLLGRDPEMYAEIVAPKPDGGAVPEGDVIRLVDTLMDVGLSSIRFEGTSMPGGVLGR